MTNNARFFVVTIWTHDPGIRVLRKRINVCFLGGKGGRAWQDLNLRPRD